MSQDLFKNSCLENLVLFRHGKAQRPHEVIDDFERNLTDSGKHEAADQAQLLKNMDFIPDIILVSMANRALQTYEEVKQQYPETKAIITRDLYLASPRVYLEHIIDTNKQNVLLIAHDPGLHDLCRHFLRGNIESADTHLLAASLPTAGVAWFKRDNNIKSGMLLVSHLRPVKSAF